MAKLDLDESRRTPAYPFVEAAHYLNLPISTLRAWCLGQGYAYKGKRRSFKRIIQLDGKPGEGLSFLNLIEAHVLAAIRRVHGVPLPKVRSALAFVSDALRIERLLAHADFQTDGIDLFVEQLGRLLNVSNRGQLEMAEILRAHLKRVERDPSGVPIKLYPFTRKSIVGEPPAPVEIDPRVSFGRPVLRKKGVPTSILADRFKGEIPCRNSRATMGSRRKRSRKRSAANSTAARRLEQAEFYLDQSIYSRVLFNRMRGLAIIVRHAGEAFPSATHDEVWLAECGTRGSIVLMRDKHVRRRPLELAALRAANVAAFVCTAGQATAEDTANAVVRLVRRFVNISISEPRPCLYSFGLSGSLTCIKLRQ